MVPWTDPVRKLFWVDLRANPYEFDAVPEAIQYPPLLQALRSLNGSRSPVFTAKCDVWAMAPEEIESLRLELDADEVDSGAGIASYIDLIWRDTSIFVSAAQQRQWITRFLRVVSTLDHPAAVVECVLRPAFLDLKTPQEGFAVSLYVKAVGPDQESTTQFWSAALTNVTRIIRGPEMAR